MNHNYKRMLIMFAGADVIRGLITHTHIRRCYLVTVKYY